MSHALLGSGIWLIGIVSGCSGVVGQLTNFGAEDSAHLTARR
jgi:hypothetical protein